MAGKISHAAAKSEAHRLSHARRHALAMKRCCLYCRHYTYQLCYVAAVLMMSPHCANWYRCFPDATRCERFEREPGSDDDAD